jgi:hypothetical protein
MLTQAQINSYRENGFLAVENVCSAAELAQARAVVEELAEQSRSITEHTEVYDLEPGHRSDAPRVRRLKTPCAVHPVFERLARAEKLLDLVAGLLGPEIRMHGNKMTLKSAESGRPVEWHPDAASCIVSQPSNRAGADGCNRHGARRADSVHPSRQGVTS